MDFRSADVVCEMDLLRTQKIRFLVDLYREMKRPSVEQNVRLELIDKVCNVLKDEESSRERDEVSSGYFYSAYYFIIIHSICSESKFQLVELLLREQKLITCRMKSKNLQPLRMRQLQFMVNIIETYDRTIETIETKGESFTTTIMALMPQAFM